MVRYIVLWLVVWLWIWFLWFEMWIGLVIGFVVYVYCVNVFVTAVCGWLCFNSVDLSSYFILVSDCLY